MIAVSATSRASAHDARRNWRSCDAAHDVWPPEVFQPSPTDADGAASDHRRSAGVQARRDAGRGHADDRRRSCIKLGYEVVVEPGAGTRADFPDERYVDAGATIGDAWQADVVLASTRPPRPSWTG